MRELETAMKNRNLTQKGLAEQLAQMADGLNPKAKGTVKFTQSEISYWLRGDFRPHHSKRPALALFLNWPMPKLVKAIEANYKKSDRAA